MEPTAEGGRGTIPEMGGSERTFGFEDLESVAFAVGLADGEGVILAVNGAACRLFARERSELVGKRWAEFTHPDDLAPSFEVLNAFRGGAAARPTFRKRLVRPDDSSIWVDLSFAPIHRDGLLRAVLVFMQDVSELNAAVESLRRNAEKLDRALELAADGLWEWDVTSERVTASRRLSVMLGIPPEEPFPDTVEWQAMIHPADAARVQAAFDELMTGGGTFQCEYRLRAPRGELRIIDRAGVLERAPDGRPTRILGAVTDVTAQRAAEEAARHSQRIDALGRLASGIAHDVNNLLTAIGGNALLLRRSRSAEETSALVSEIELAVRAAANLTRNLLVFSTRQPGAPEKVAVGRQVEATGRLLHRLVGDGVQLRVQVSAVDPVVLIDRSHIDQILVNLVVNARDAMAGSGTIAVTVDAVELATAVLGWPRSVAGPHARITVADQGAGMTDEVKQHVFEPFFTTKPRGFGTGLGLSTVHGIVEQHGGSIEIDTAPGVGTTFRVHLPALADALVTSSESSAEWVRGDERIILVDDDRLVRDMVGRTLELLGYRVTVFPSAQDCLQALPRLASAHLLITDIRMPGMDGRELARRVSEAAPRMRILLISGDAGHAGHDDALPLLSKPFAPGQLARKIREVLT